MIKRSILLITFLTGCSGGFSANPEVLQTETRPDTASEVEIPAGTLDEAFVGAETSLPVAESSAAAPRSSASAGGAAGSSASTTGGQSQNANPATRKSPLIRVRLWPVVSKFKYDPYLNSENEKSVSLANESGLKILDLKTRVELNSKEVQFDFDKKIMTVNGVEQKFADADRFRILPVDSGIATSVKLKIDRDRLVNNARILKGQENLTFRGSFSVELLREKVTPKSQLRFGLLNILPLETYLISVVASEVPRTFHPQAIRAQAIAARTYAVRNMIAARCPKQNPKQCRDRGWDVDPSTKYQSYVGARKENAELVTPFVASTFGQVLTYRNSPILAMFYASSGGKTSSAKAYFCSLANAVAKLVGLKVCGDQYSADYPYLVEEVDPFNGDSKRFGHGVGLPQNSANTMAKAGFTGERILAQYYKNTSVTLLRAD